MREELQGDCYQGFDSDLEEERKIQPVTYDKYSDFTDKEIP